ncbi:Arginyl-tRNA--protein transferase 1 [Kickxella alabastrina]|uniref:Arginyl-tRNA--protein transferase 1 n=1 Tax=Kickxella alabastrina TaxID=61397 RepID=A0ACC1INL8_9FUNG|nr:Arginyl-tRNA--protein transferase 1 [Kickxella alabastrina]
MSSLTALDTKNKLRGDCQNSSSNSTSDDNTSDASSDYAATDTDSAASEISYCSADDSNSNSNNTFEPGTVPDSDSKKGSRITLLGIQERSKCGYCKTPNGSRCFMIKSKQITCTDYQALIDRGWRRSGLLMYLTDHSDSCCAYYPIRTHALEHSLGASDKKLLRRWRKRFAKNKMDGGAAAVVDKKEVADEMVDMVCGLDGGGLKVVMEPAQFTEAKYRVFEKYQKAVHDEESTPKGFEWFLCATPLVPQSMNIPNPASDQQTRLLPHGLGTYHQCYYIDGKLAAVSVLDILPSCVSAVYFFYDPEFSPLSMGTYSALREMALVRELHCIVPSLQYYYLGYYIPGCNKMTYKGRWRPADLLDLLTFNWVPIEHCLRRISEHPVFCTFDTGSDTHSEVMRDTAGECVAAAAPALKITGLGGLCVDDVRRWRQLVVWLDLGYFGGRLVPMSADNLASISKSLELVVLQAYAALGVDVACRTTLVI